MDHRSTGRKAHAEVRETLLLSNADDHAMNVCFMATINEELHLIEWVQGVSYFDRMHLETG